MKTTAILASLALALMANTGCDDDAAGGETQADMGNTQDGGGAGGAGNEGGGGVGGAGNEGGVGGEGGAGNEGGVGGEGGAGNEGGVGGEGGAGNEGGAGGVGGEGGAGNEGGEGGMGGAGGGEPAEGPVNSGRLDSLSIADPGAPQCRDLNGDGTPDNSFGGLAGLANAEIEGAIADDDLILLTTSIGIDAPGLMGAFDLALFTAERDGGTGYIVDADAIGPDGLPLILFRGAQVNGGVMRAGPGDFNLQVPVQGENLDLSVTNTQIDATMGIDAAGLSLGSGTISGQISQADLDAALVVVPAEFRGLVPLLLQPDIDSDGNGSPDSYSICLNFTSAPATMSGYPVE